MANTVVNENVFVVGTDGAQKFVDFKGLDYFWEKAKGYVDTADAALNTALSGRITTEKNRIDDLAAIVGELTGTGTEGQSIADRINAAIAALDLPNTYAGKTATEQAIATAKSGAEATAQAYTDGQVSGMATTLRGEMAEGVQGAKDYADGQVSGMATTLRGEMAEGVQGAKDYADGQVSGMATTLRGEMAEGVQGAKDYADGLNEAMDTRVKVLEGIDHEGIVNAAINDFATKVSNDDVVNTYKELIDYAAEHGAEFTELVGVVNGKADKTYVDEQDAALAGRVKALEDVKDAYVEADNTLATTLRGEIATAKSGAEATAQAYTDQEVGKVSATVTTLTGTVADNLAAAKTYAEEKANAAETAAKADTATKLASYTNTTDMNAAIATAKSEAIADAKGKIDSLTEVVNAKADTSYVDSKDGETLTAAKTYASTYTDLLFASVKFVNNGDIDSIFEQTHA